MKSFYSILLLIMCLISVSLAHTTRNVPSQYSTIQAALNAAQSGDTVLVQPGTYKENIVWPEVNGILLAGCSNEDTSIIDGNHSGIGIYIYPQLITIDTNTIIKNIKIRNAYSTDKGA